MIFFSTVNNIEKRGEVTMKNLLSIGLLLMTTIILTQYANAVTIVTNNTTTPKYDYYNSQTDVYDRDLDSIERYLFSKTYRSNTLQSRLNRIERKVFNRCYPSWNPTRRINHILANYNSNNNRNYIADYQYRKPVQRVRNRFIGQPTGFTPSFIDMPFGSGFGNRYGTGYNQSFGSNTGYGFLNSIPAMTNAGIKILD